MTNLESKPAAPGQKTAMYFILGLPVIAVIVIIGIGIYAQRDNITPRWKEKESPAAELVKDGGPEGVLTNAPAKEP